MLVSLPWYDLAAVQTLHDRLWRHLRSHLVRHGLAAPAELTRCDPANALLLRDDLLLSQTCGYVVAGVGRDLLLPVATPRYAAPGCEGSGYRSFLVVGRHGAAERLEDLRGARCAVNDALSHSGVNCLRTLVAPLATGGRFFAEVTVTGGHERCMEMLAQGAADVAAIDCITHALLARHRPDLVTATRVIGITPLAPAPPLVTPIRNAGATVEALRGALRDLFADAEAQQARDDVLLAGFDVRPVEHYDGMIADVARAAAAGYTEMSWPEVIENGRC